MYKKHLSESCLFKVFMLFMLFILFIFLIFFYSFYACEITPNNLITILLQFIKNLKEFERVCIGCLLQEYVLKSVKKTAKEDFEMKFTKEYCP